MQYTPAYLIYWVQMKMYIDLTEISKTTFLIIRYIYKYDNITAAITRFTIFVKYYIHFAQP